MILNVAIFGACESKYERSATQGSTVDTTAIRASLDSVAKVVTRANQTGNVELFASTWAENGAMSGAGSPLIQGRDSIVSAFKNRPALPPGAEMTIHPIEIRVMSNDWAYVFGVDSLNFTPKDASQSITKTSTFLVIVRRTPDGWKTYREVLSANQSSDN